MKNVALITGASAGIGRDLARLHAQRGGDLVLTARRHDRLNELKLELEKAFGVQVMVLSEDLACPDSPQRIFDATEGAGIKISTLINNAGLGGHGLFSERPIGQELAMIDLNIRALITLTYLYLPGMKDRGAGRVLNVASTAGFIPGPNHAVYHATKAFVLSFSLAISEELRGSGVTVTALCPGAVETEFADVAGLEGVSAAKNAASSMSVAKCGYRAMEKEKLVVIDSFLLSLFLSIAPLLPRRLVLKITGVALSKK